MEYFGGLGRPAMRLTELGHSFEEANRAFAYRYLKKRNQIIDSSRETEEMTEKDDIRLDDLDVRQLDRRVAESFLKTGLKSQIPHCKLLKKKSLK